MSSSQAFTIGYSQRDTFNGRTESPGPTQYDDTNGQKVIKEHSPEWTFSKTGRSSINGGGPGPGYYEANQERVNGQSFSMGGRTQNQSSYGKYQQQVPGPGQYDASNHLKQSPSYTIGSRQAVQDNNGTPGPGSYSQRTFTETKQGRASNVGFGSKVSQGGNQTSNSFFSNKLSSPGPGQYQPILDQTRERNPTYGFSKGQKGASLRDISPGPGFYDDSNIKGFSNNGIQVSMGGRPQTAKPNQTPGPGQYDVSDNNQMVRNTQQNYSAMKSNVPRMANLSRDFQSPGPGQYNASEHLVREKTPVVSFNNSRRGGDFSGSDHNNLLGPGSYNVQSQKSGPKYSMGQVPRKSHKNNNPGPGNYQVNNQIVKDAIRSFKIGTASKNNNNNLSSSKSTSQIVGPGSYQQVNNDFGRTAPKFTMKSRPQDNNVNRSPGPGAYQPNASYSKDKPPTYSIKNTKRDMSMSRSIDVPGPGSYQANNHLRSSTPSYTLGQRQSYKNDTLSPGPGAYHSNNQLTTSHVPSFSQSQSKRDNFLVNNRQHSPGPGNYSRDEKTIGKDSTSYTMGKKNQHKNETMSPGPGAYNQKDSLVKDQAKSFKMSTTSRQDIVSKEKKQTPGPGNYKSDNKFGESARKTTIKGRPKDQKADKNPGPGNYNPKTDQVKDKTRSYKMGSSKRQDFVSSSSRQLPGPGMYESPTRFGNEGPVYTMQSKRKDVKRDNTPGPGEYDVRESISKEQVQSYKMSQSSRQTMVVDSSQNPGPGNYHQGDQFGKSGVHYSINQKSTQQNRNENPGPGQYDNNVTQVKESVRVYKMSQTSRQDIVSREAKDMPGPGNYAEGDQFGKDSKSFTIRERRNERNETLSPGPGGYSPSHSFVKDNVVSYKMSNSVRQDLVSKESRSQPGPGNYESPSRMGKGGPQYTMGNRSSIQQETLNPGPGAYQPSDQLVKEKTKTAFIGQSQRDELVSKQAKEMPGPGNNYTEEKFGKDSQSFTIRGRSKEVQRYASPGPGEYEESDNLTKERVVSHKMSQSQRQELVSREAQSNPGPGNYSQADEFGKNAVSYSIKGKNQEIQRDEVPGPGDYDRNDNFVKDRVVTYKMSQSHRQELVSKEAVSKPGPGNYENNDEFGKDAKSFTIRGKSQYEQANEVPGPGEYDANFSQTKDRTVAYVVSKSQRQEFVSKEAKNLPGPGVYDSPERFGKEGQSYTIRGRSVEKIDNKVPGPGEYDYNNSQVKESIVSYKMSQTHRQEIVSSEARNMPGPGNYASPERFGKEGQSFTIQGKHNDLTQEQRPGPGEYDQNSSLVKDRVVSHKMSTSQRQEIVSKEERSKPGPGNYDSPERFGKDGQTFTIQGKPSDLQHNNNPGPGEYEQNQSQTKDRVQSHKIGTSSRQDIVSKEEQNKPGPGNYYSPERFGKDSHSYTIQGKSSETYANNVPGPGEYEQNLSQTKDRVQSYTISHSQRQELVSKEEYSKPGPGNYHSPTRFGQGAQSFTIRGKSNDHQADYVPGPGEYDQNYSYVKDSVVTYKISSSKRQEIVSKEAQNQLGPGAYDSPERFGKDGQSFTIRGKNYDNADNKVPGPGEYEQNLSATRDRVISHKISQSQREELVSNEMRNRVGPGQYDNHDNFGADTQSFLIRGRPQDIERNNNPGPGEYEQNLSATRDRVISHKISQSQRQDIISSEEKNKLGPGNYDTHDNFGADAQSFLIRGRPQEIDRNNNPGPGEYEQELGVTKDRVISHKISQSQRLDIISSEERNRVGPGNYNNNDNFGADAQSFMIRGRPQEQQNNRNPGPGSYSPSHEQTKDRSITYNMSRSERHDIITKEQREQIGPGTYNYNREFGADAQSFVISGKANEMSQSNIPGPGSYDGQDKYVRYSSPSFKISQSNRGEMISNEQRERPGPGNYENYGNFGDDAQSFQIRGRAHEQQSNQNPGPGAYQSQDQYVRHSSPSHTISQSNRANLITNEEAQRLGPGQYDQESYIGKGQAASIRGRPSPDRDSNIPGPGEYNAKYDIVKDKIQAASLGKSRRDFLTVQDGLIGPGSYDLTNMNNGPSYTIQGGPPTNYDNNIPGPGSYQADYNYSKDRIGSVDFGRQSIRDDRSGSPQRQQNPGPGQYDQRDYNIAGNDSIVYSFSKAGALDDDNGNPGPGHYKLPCKFADIPPYSIPPQNEQYKYV